MIVACPDCGAAHHARCWQACDGCGTYDCAPSRRTLGANREPALRITADDLDRCVPLSRPAPFAPGAAAGAPVPRSAQSGRCTLATVALVVAVAGIALVGAVTGLVAILLGSLALGDIYRTRRRGAGVAVAAVLLGVADVVGWVVFLAVVLSRPGPVVSIADFEPDLAVLEGDLAPHISRAMRANVLIETQQGWTALRATGIGSGVIVALGDDSATVVTNRHVVDPAFAHDPDSAGEVSQGGSLSVRLVGQPPLPGQILWVAPDGIDLALVGVRAFSQEVRAAPWRRGSRPALGDEVFSIGNPQGLGWTRTGGSVSQLRTQQRGSRKISVIQTDTAINPGNSGGGLYDAEGNLIGINTWTNDKRFSEGLSFAIAFDSLLSLHPPFPKASRLEEPAKKP